MRIQIFVPAFFRISQIDGDGHMTLSEDACLKDVYKKLLIPHRLSRIFLCHVNYEMVPINTKLNDGDIVSFIFPVFGG